MTENIIVPSEWDIKYEHPAGETGSKFLADLRDEKRVWGRKCPKCERVLLPPRSFCDQCFVETTEWVEVGQEGPIKAFTIITEDLGSGPEPPFALAYAQLDGADTALLNQVKGLDLSDPDEVNKRVDIDTPVSLEWKSDGEREAKITDFYYVVE